MQNGKALVWLRRDFRLHDQPALFEACRAWSQVVPVFVIDPRTLDDFAPGKKPHAYFFGGLLALREKLKTRGKDILLREGDPRTVLPELARQTSARAVYYNKDYEPYGRTRDTETGYRLKDQGVQVHAFKDHVIFEESEVLSGGGTPFRVFTPYKNAVMKRLAEEGLPELRGVPRAESFDDSLFPDGQSQGLWQRLEVLVEQGRAETRGQMAETGETAARARFKKFLEKGIATYSETRNLPAVDGGTSRLSGDFRSGTLSCRWALRCAMEAEAPKKERETFVSELLWHDFFMMIGHHFPHVFERNYNSKYDGVKWRNDPEAFRAWCEGRTGYPIVDAGMRELVSTGFMHNRVRMITAMFLVKDLLIDWREGERFFREHLVDGDLAVNNGNWQWSASTGVDAQPYFRIFNPTTQGEKFDPEEIYIRHHIPELRSPGGGYPAPIVDHAQARNRTLAAFNQALGKEKAD